MPDEPVAAPTTAGEQGTPPLAGTAGPNLGSIGLFPSGPAAAQTEKAADTRTAAPSAESVLAEDWWSHARPAFEIHGFFRFRGELFHNFSLGRSESPGSSLWPRPLDSNYRGDDDNEYGPRLCTPNEAGVGDLDDPTLAGALGPCDNSSNAGANVRFKLAPELHVSDNLRVVSQIDLLDNIVMGSTPTGYAFHPGASGYTVAARPGEASNGVFDDNIVAPTSGVNSLDESIRVKRVWGEYTTPVGQLRFGRMPDHFGLGMLHNSGDGYDDDYQSTIDRLQFISAIKPLDLYVGGSWDFPNEGAISGSSLRGGQPHDMAQLDDVDQWSLLLMRKQSDELEKGSLARGQLVLNGGAYVTLRKQLLANDKTGSETGANSPTATPDQLAADGLGRRGAELWVPDLWLQLKYRKFRFEAEFATVLGSLESTDTASGATEFQRNDLERKIRQYGLATEIEQKLVEDRLRLGFGFGWASGDPDAYNATTTNNLVAEPGQRQVNDDTISTFRFHPAYRVDLILHRHLLQRVQGTYYFHPSVEYDFMQKPSGQKVGGGAGVVWSRASEFVQAPGHASDLGVELNASLYFQSKDGATNDRPEKMGGFYSKLEYGVLFPMAGLGYQAGEGGDTSAAQILRLYLGVLY